MVRVIVSTYGLALVLSQFFFHAFLRFFFGVEIRIGIEILFNLSVLLLKALLLEFFLGKLRGSFSFFTVALITLTSVL